MTKMVLMPSELSDEDLIAALLVTPEDQDYFKRAESSKFLSVYSRVVQRLSQPSPQQGWNDAIREVLDIIHDGDHDRSNGSTESDYNAVEALLDQQPPAWRDMESSSKDIVTYVEAKSNLEESKCKACSGIDKCDDMDFGDISFNEWECKDCKGTGLIGWMPLPEDPE